MFLIVLSFAIVSFDSNIFEQTGVHRCGRVIAGLGCLLLSPLNMVVLKTRYEMKQQEAIEAARSLGDNTLSLFMEAEQIEAKILEFIQHELGNF